MKIRTRFAPSPTGYLHVGGLRAALYNYLFARQNGGEFILRIEDTDQTREVEGAVENLIEVFRWVGLVFDEGPHLGGPFGPYVQSERLSVYSEQIQTLKHKGAAYPCFCSSERLEEVRTRQTAQGVPPMYDRKCRTLTTSESAIRIEGGEAHVWRLAVPMGESVHVRDLIRGDVDFATGTIDDQILLKSDGFPTYHLANVIDDHFMQISHVIRGEEWLPSAPKHVLLYQAFGWDVPQFAHLPLILNPDRSKMSKRSGDVAVEAYREKGILPETLLNFVALLGWHPADERELFSLEELVKEFSLDRVQKAGAVFDVVKLRWMNSEYLKRVSDDQLFNDIRLQIEDVTMSEDEPRVRLALTTLRGGIETLAELAERVRSVFGTRGEDEPEMLALLRDETAREFLQQFRSRIENIDRNLWNDFSKLEAEFKAVTSESGKLAGLKGKALWQTLRAALTGQAHGPELAKLVGIWGRDRVLSELHTAISRTHEAVRP